MTRAFRLATAAACVAAMLAPAAAAAPQGAPAALGADASAKAAPPAAGPATPDGYVIGTDDVLTIVFWREKDMSSDVIVRPDGRITLPLINDVMAAGLTPDELRARLDVEGARFLEKPAASVTVKQINSRKVFITGEVQKPGLYPLTAPTTVVQLIAIAGGLRDYARKTDIIVLRPDGGRQVTFPFDYEAIGKRQKLEQNITLKPGDTVLVP